MWKTSPFYSILLDVVHFFIIIIAIIDPENCILCSIFKQKLNYLELWKNNLFIFYIQLMHILLLLWSRTLPRNFCNSYTFSNGIYWTFI